MIGKELDQVIFGADATERIVAVETDAKEVTTYRRTPEGVTAERCELRPCGGDRGGAAEGDQAAARRSLPRDGFAESQELRVCGI